MILKNLEQTQFTGSIATINNFLKENYGYSISDKASVSDLNAMHKSALDKISKIKESKSNVHSCPEYNEQILVLNGIALVLEGKQINESSYKQSENYMMIVSNLADFVIKNVSVGDSFEEALAEAMKYYRSSKYRFPETEVEYDVKMAASGEMGQGEPTIMANEDITNDDTEEVIEGDFHPDQLNDPEMKGKAQSYLDKVGSSLSLEPKEDDPEDLDKGWVNDSARYGKTNKLRMKEGFVKDLRALMENEVAESEVIMSAKGISSDLQEMLEKIGRIMNEHLGPIGEQMSQIYGSEVGDKYYQDTHDRLESTLDVIRNSMFENNRVIDGIASSGNFGSENDMGGDLGGLGSMGDEEMPADDMDLDVGLDAELPGDDMFGADDFDEPLGRAQKETNEQRLDRAIRSVQHKLAEAKRARAAKK